jgi:hypothetical protein
VWSAIFSVAYVYNVLYVPFSIGLDFEISGYYIIIDVLAVVIFITDSILRPFLAVNK